MSGMREPHPTQLSLSISSTIRFQGSGLKMPNYRISSGNEFISRGVPLHAVDFTCDPLDIRRVAGQFRKAGNWENMVKRVIETKDNLLTGVGAAIVLVFQLLTDKLSMLGGLQAVNRSLLEVARLAERVTSIFHCGQAGAFTATGAKSRVAHFLFPFCGTSFLLTRTGRAMNGIISGWYLTAVSTKTSCLQSVIASQVLLTVRRGIAFWVLSFPSFNSRSVSCSSFFGCFEFAYTLFSQGVNLRSRFANWLGSLSVQPLSEPLVFYSKTSLLSTSYEDV